MTKAYLKIRDKNTGEVYGFYGDEIIDNDPDSFSTIVTGDGGMALSFDAPFSPDIITVAALDEAAVRNSTVKGGIMYAISNRNSTDVIGTSVAYVGQNTASTALGMVPIATAAFEKRNLISSEIKKNLDGSTAYAIKYQNLLSSDYLDGLNFTSGVDYAVICKRISE